VSSSRYDGWTAVGSLAALGFGWAHVASAVARDPAAGLRLIAAKSRYDYVIWFGIF
jgi:hypothetical protein